MMPISTRHKAPEVHHLPALSRARVLVAPERFLDQDYASIARQLHVDAPTLTHRVCVPDLSDFVRFAGSSSREAAMPIGSHRITHAVGSDAMFDRMLGQSGTGDIAVAFVTGKSAGCREAALQAHGRERLAGHKIPHRVRVVDAFPVVSRPHGVKIQKRVLREMAGVHLAGVPNA